MTGLAPAQSRPEDFYAKENGLDESNRPTVTHEFVQG